MANWRGKIDEAADAIRWLSGRKPDGIPLDVSDDVAVAAAKMPPPRTRYVDMSPESAAQLDAAVRGDVVLSGIDAGPLDDAPDFELGSPLWHQLDKGWRAHDNLRRNRTGNLRNQNPEIARIAGADIRARDADALRVRSADAERARGLREGSEEIALAAVAAGVPFLLSQGIDTEPRAGGEDLALTSTSGTEDLVEESRPAPRVAAEPSDDPDYSYEARQLMNKLNAMRRRAGGEVPEAKSMMAEIDRLLGMANKKRNAPDYKPAMPTDYHGEAQRLLQKLNAMRMEAGGEVPETQKIMAEVRRLQAMGDRMRNAG